MLNKKVSENDADDDNSNFFWNKKKGKKKGLKKGGGGGGGGWGRNKGFWPEYLPMKLIVKTLERILD